MSLEFGRIDVHSHILPSLDDGSTSVHESLDMARRLVGAGYTHIFCTPHVWPVHRQHRPAFIAQQVDRLQSSIDQENIGLKLFAGAELNLSLDIFSFPIPEIPTYANAGKFVLFDFWDGRLSEHFWMWIRFLKQAGMTPILGHPERNQAIQSDPDIMHELAREGVLLQVNLESLTGALGRSALRVANKLLEEKRCFMLGSDAHRLDSLDIRFEGIDRAIELVGSDEVDRLMKINPMKLLPSSMSQS